MHKTDDAPWSPSACMLCSIGCGIEVQIKDRHLTRIRGDKSNPVSQGYVCQKAGRLDHYQNHSMRLTRPLKRNAEGEFEEIDWQIAIAEIAERMQQIKSQHGGHAFAYYGGGGQGNHLGGVYSGALRAALGTPYLYSALAQEKTGDFWVNGKLFGKQSCYVTEAMEHADYVIVLGANPWSAHGVQRTRDTLKAICKDPDRTLVVIDPRVTETAKMADIHLQVQPGKDAWLLSAMIAEIFHNQWEDKSFLDAFTEGASELRKVFLGVKVDQYATEAGVDPALLRQVAKGFALARTGSVRADLGIQQSHNSTLNSYLEKLLFLVTGKFNREGCNHLIAQFAPLIGHSPSASEGGVKTRVTGMEGIAKLFPPNILPQEILSDQDDRVRAMIVDSANPALSAADTTAFSQALDALELLVVIDVAKTETARKAHYILPAASQFEKSECTFFTFGFPEVWFHLRRPLLSPEEGTLTEPEIYFRLLVALGVIPERFILLEKALQADSLMRVSRFFPLTLAGMLKLKPQWQAYLPVILYSVMRHRTSFGLSAGLPDELASAATLWGVTQLFSARYPRAVARAGLNAKGGALGQALFERVLNSDRPVMVAKFSFEETWDMVKTPNGKVLLSIPQLLSQIPSLGKRKHSLTSKHYPFLLMAGERRAYNANQIFRTAKWRKTDLSGGLRIHPQDMASLGLTEDSEVIVRSSKGQVQVSLIADDGMLPGVVSLPHGYGMSYVEKGRLVTNGPAINLLTDMHACDPIAKTPYHKQVPVSLIPVATGLSA